MVYASHQISDHASFDVSSHNFEVIQAADMAFTFFKYQGAGNDFVMVDDRNGQFGTDLSVQRIALLCDRHFGIGADGLILLRSDSHADFRMVYFNSDGRESTMCGNGGRCIVAFAHDLGLIKQDTSFNAIDGLHAATIIEESTVKLQMIDVPFTEIKSLEADSSYLFTGSPHVVLWSAGPVSTAEVKRRGHDIRYSQAFAHQNGTNVNFAWLDESGKVTLRTYERGVEDETLACGTGTVAVALDAATRYQLNSPIMLKAMGGDLAVSFDLTESGFQNIWLTGPAKQVFSGQWPA